MAVKPFEIQETLCSPHLQESYFRVRDVRPMNAKQSAQTPGQSMFKNQYLVDNLKCHWKGRLKMEQFGKNTDFFQNIKKFSVM